MQYWMCCFMPSQMEICGLSSHCCDREAISCNFIATAGMSALGQKQTHAVQQRMSALPPIATAKADMGQCSCLLYPRKRTCAVQSEMSAKGQKRTSLS